MKIGLLGGGQLAQMLALACEKMAIPVGALARSTELSIRSTNAAIFDADNVVSQRSFFDSHQAFVAESEFFDFHSIPEAKRHMVYPSLDCLSTLSNRDLQKQCLESLNTPTAEFWEDLEVALRQNGLPLVAKVKRGGFDGRGTFLLKSAEDLRKFKDRNDVDKFIFEQFVSFERELAIVAARNRLGEVYFYDLVETHQVDAQLSHLMGPVLSSHLEQIKMHIEKLLHHLNYCGVLGVEIFDIGETWLINELAPRVHNSGHYTLWTHTLSQFDLCVGIAAGTNTGFNPEKHENEPSYCMYNLIGRAGVGWDPKSVLNSPWVHWYHKQNPDEPSASSGRKLGHMLAFGLDTKEAQQKALLKLNSLKIEIEDENHESKHSR